MIHIDEEYLEDEIRDGFYIPSMTKRTWAMELTVLDLIDSICRKHDITYYAMWGTFLGAVRHKGFVPWDDDLDICMKRCDLEKFVDVALSELPCGYKLMSYKNNDYSWKFIVNVVPNERMCFEPSYLISHFAFPYIVAVDIFILDNISDNDETEALRNETVKKLLTASDLIGSEKQYDIKKIKAYIQTLTGHVIADDVTPLELKRLIYSEVDNILKAESKNETAFISQKMPLSVYYNKKFEKKMFEKTIRIPFEMTEIPVPLFYDHILRQMYGNYMNIVMGGGGHAYPYYMEQKKQLKTDMEYPPMYEFNESDLYCEKDFSGSVKVISGEIKDYLSECLEIYGNIDNCVGDSEYSVEEMTGFLADVQNALIDYGTLIEKVKGEENIVIKSLEDYCDLLFKLAECITKPAGNITESADIGKQDVNSELQKTAKKISSATEDILNIIDREVINRKSVLFLPVRIKYWDSLKRLYEQAISDDNTDVYVVVLPYYYKEYDGSFKEGMNYEIEEFRSLSIDAISYEDFNIPLVCPDIIYINNPYDEYNMSSSVPKDFYAKNIRRYTSCLKYVHFFAASDFEKSNYPCFYNMRYYCTMPGVVMADVVITPSSSMRMRYIEKLKEWSKKDIWDSKIKVCDIDKEKNATCANTDSACVCAGAAHASADAPSVSGKGKDNKKSILWYINVSTLIGYDDRYFEKAYGCLKVFTESKDRIHVFLMTDEYTGDTLKSTRPHLYEKWTEFILRFKQLKIGTYVNDTCEDSAETAKTKEIIKSCEAYYGDPSAVCKDFIIMKKPVMIQNTEIGV